MTECFGRDKKNYIFLGESGCGKSEIALNLAASLMKRGDREVHLFDLDQTKPLMRSRDVCRQAEQRGIKLHFEEQFFDAPTEVGGVREKMRDPHSYVILDIGGNETGARLVGGYAPFLNSKESVVYYVVNPYRPWSGAVEAIDGTLTSILRASRVKEFHFLCNPNVGESTTAEEFFAGLRKTREMLDAYYPVELACVNERLYEQVREDCELPLFPLCLYLGSLFD